MTGADVIELIQKFWLQFVLTSISGVLAWKCKKWYNETKEQKQKRAQEIAEENRKRDERMKIIEAAVLAMLHDRLLQSLVFFLRSKEVTSDECDNLRSMYDSYTALGGNGTIKILWERFKQYVKIVPPDYLE